MLLAIWLGLVGWPNALRTRSAEEPQQGGLGMLGSCVNYCYEVVCSSRPSRAGFAAATSRAVTRREAEQNQGASTLAVCVQVGTVVLSGRTC